MPDPHFIERMRQGLIEEQMHILKRLQAKEKTGHQILENWEEPTDPEDIANFTQEETIFHLLSEREVQELQHIKDALHRIEKGTYGICRMCGKEIDPDRLEIVPTAELCERCVRET